MDLKNVKPEALKNLKKVKTEVLRAELRRRGFQVDNLWCLEDVTSALNDVNDNNDTKLKLTKVEKMEVLIEALTGDGVMIAVNEALSEILEEKIS